MTPEFKALEAASTYLSVNDAPHVRRAFVLYLIERFKIDLGAAHQGAELNGTPTGRTASMNLPPALAAELSRSLPVRPPQPPAHLKHPTGVQTTPPPHAPAHP